MHVDRSEIHTKSILSLKRTVAKMTIIMSVFLGLIVFLMFALSFETF